MIGKPAIKSWQKKVEPIKIVIPKSGCIKTKVINIIKKIKVAAIKYFLPWIDCAIPQDTKITKNGFITSEGWNEKLYIFNHLLAHLT